MKIEPLRKVTFNDYALLTPGIRSLYVETKWGASHFQTTRDVENALAKLKGFTCYVTHGLEQLKNTTSARSWQMTTWRGKGIKMTHIPTGVVVTSLRSTLEHSRNPFADLDRTLTWLRGYGVNAGSISSMSWKLLRASLGGMVPVYFDPELSERAFFGGRQEIKKPGISNNAKLYDLSAAYPSAMASRDVALALKKVSPLTDIDPLQAGLAEIRVTVPDDLEYPPLPVRLSKQAIQFQRGTFEGVYSWVEIDAAKRLGCDVEILNCYAPSRTADLFSNWWIIAQEGRHLPGESSHLAKAIANSTWGQFAMRGDDRAEINWADDKGREAFITSVDPRAMPHITALGIAAEITARVRTQTLLEGIYASDVAPEHVDTDGIILPFKAKPPKNLGTGFGQWREKESMSVVQILAPQFYRFRRESEWYFNDEGVKVEAPWNYVASGMSHDLAQKTFERNPVESQIAYLSISDVCLPAANASDQALIDRLLLEAKTLGVA